MNSKYASLVGDICNTLDPIGKSSSCTLMSTQLHPMRVGSGLDGTMTFSSCMPTRIPLPPSTLCPHGTCSRVGISSIAFQRKWASITTGSRHEADILYTSPASPSDVHSMSCLRSIPLLQQRHTPNLMHHQSSSWRDGPIPHLPHFGWGITFVFVFVVPSPSC